MLRKNCQFGTAMHMKCADGNIKFSCHCLSMISNGMLLKLGGKIDKELLSTWGILDAITSAFRESKKLDETTYIHMYVPSSKAAQGFHTSF